MREWVGETVGPDVWETCQELLPAGSVFTFLTEHRGALFPAEMFADKYPSANGRPSMPPQILAAAVTLQALHGLSDFEMVQELRCDLRWKAACGLGLNAMAFDASLAGLLPSMSGPLCPAQPRVRGRARGGEDHRGPGRQAPAGSGRHHAGRRGGHPGHRHPADRRRPCGDPRSACPMPPTSRPCSAPRTTTPIPANPAKRG